MICLVACKVVCIDRMSMFGLTVGLCHGAACRGLAVSIATDQAQGIASMLLALILVIYVAVTYR